MRGKLPLVQTSGNAVKATQALLVTLLMLNVAPIGSVGAAEPMDPATLLITDQDRLNACAGAPDACLVDAFFNDTEPARSWSYPLFSAPAGVPIPPALWQNSFLLTTDGDEIVAYVAVGNQIYALRGGSIENALDANGWYHVAMTYSSGSWRLYLNGNVVALRSDVSGSLHSSTAPLMVGRIDTDNSARYEGGVGDLRTYAQALSPSELNAAMDDGTESFLVGGATTPIQQESKGMWLFNEGSGNVADDEANLANGIIKGGATWITQHNGNGILLDGVDDYVEMPQWVGPLPNQGFTALGWFQAPATLPDDPRPLVGQWSLGPELRIVDTGIRRAGHPQAYHHAVDDLNQTWDPVLLCRFYLNNTIPLPCTEAIGPTAALFGLNLAWTPSPLDRLQSEWRIATPTTGVRDVYQRVHGLDATLLHLNSPVATANSGVAPTGHLELTCSLLPLASYAALETDGDLPASLALQDCPPSQVASSPPKTVPAAGDLLWCDNPITNHTSDIHRFEVLEQSLWAAASTCHAITGGVATATWDEVLANHRADFATNVTKVINATTDAARQSARNDVNETLRGALADRLALWWAQLGMPENATFDPLDPTTVLAANDFNVVDLSASNIQLGTPQVSDDAGGWTNVTDSGRFALTRARLPVQLDFVGVQGEAIARDLYVVLDDVRPDLLPNPTIVQYGETITGSVVAADPDNVPYFDGFLPPGQLPFSFPLVNVSQAGTFIDDGLFEAAFKLPADATNVTACVRQLWTGDATGELSNVMSSERLAIEPAELATCNVLPIGQLIRLHLFESLTITLEVREDASLVDALAWHELIGAPFEDFINKTNLLEPPTLEEALDATILVNDAIPTQAGAIRVVLSLPPMAPEVKADVLAGLLLSLAGVVDTFAFEMYDVPLTTKLDDGVRRAAEDYGATILTPAGNLPPALATASPFDKMLSITGLASHPSVITIGAGNLSEGVHPLSRVGPTPLYTPKPDFIAPSPAGTTIGAVLNTIPFVEALSLRGVKNTHAVRGILAGMSVPVRNSDGVAATFYEQGYGALDLAAYLKLPPINIMLDQVAAASGTNASTVKANAMTALQVNETAFNATTPQQLFGALGSPAAVLRAALGKSLLNLTIDSPAIPSTLIVDHGVVNHNLSGNALVLPLDLDPAINATINSVRLLLEEAGKTGTDLDDLLDNLLGQIKTRTIDGQDVTINVTHYYLFDLLKEDFLYTLYNETLNFALADHSEILAESYADYQDPTQAFLGPILNWTLDPHFLVPEWHDTVSMELNITEDCIRVPAMSTAVFGDAVLAALRSVAGALAGSTQETAGAAAIADLPIDSQTALSRDSQRFLQQQFDQLTCLEDIKEYLETLREVADSLRQIKSQPLGLWTESEQRLGRWDESVLGGAINATLAELEIDPAEFTQNGTQQVLITTIGAIDHTLDLIEQKISLLKIPKASIVSMTKPILATDPAKTSDTAKNPLGPYTGLTFVTSHNVTVYNPFTGDPIITRDISIPLPSFLWNNPTLTMSAAFRDGSPLSDTTMLLHNAQPRIFEEINVNLTVTVDDVIVPLVPTLNETMDGELDFLDEYIAAIEAAINNTTVFIGTDSGKNATAQAHPYDTWLDRLDRALEAAQQRRDHVLQVRDNATVQTDVSPAAALIDPLLRLLYSRLTYQSQTVDPVTGESVMPNLFPGTYQLFMPYPYNKLTEMGLDYGYANAGTGVYQNPLQDLQYEVELLSEQVTGSLEPHPSAAVQPEPAPPLPGVPIDPANTTYSWYPGHEVDGTQFEPFHQFKLDITGPDVMGLLCMVVRELKNATQTPLGVPGCDTGLLDADVLLQLVDDVTLAKCLTGQDDPMFKTDASQCSDIYGEHQYRTQECRAGNEAQCMAARRIQSQLNASRALSLALPGLLPDQSLLVPMPSSVMRVVQANPAAFGFNTTNLVKNAFNPTLNPGQTKENVTAAVGKVLLGIGQYLADAVEVTEPPLETRKDVIQTQGVLHHVTDKVSGLDWWHADTTLITEPLVSELWPVTGAEIKADLSLLPNMITNATDKAVIESLVENITNASDADVHAQYTGNITAGPVEKAARIGSGWRPGGAVTSGMLPYATEARQESATGAQMCADASDLSGLQESFFTCVAGYDYNQEFDCSIGRMRTDMTILVNELLTQYRLDASRTALDLFGGAVEMASVGHGWHWTRTNDGIIAESFTDVQTCGQADLDTYTPVPAVLYYTTPMPAQEVVGVRIGAEIVTKDTFVVMINTPDSEIADAIVGALDGVSVAASPTASPDPIRRITAVLTKLDDEASIILADSDIRVDIMGFPLRYETFDLVAPCDGGGCHSSIQSLAAVRSSGYYNYTREYDFRTQPPGAASPGSDALHTMLLFFPSISGGGTPGAGEKVIVRNFTVQMDTFIGLQEPYAEVGDGFTMDFPIRYRANVEDWQMLYAVPDIQPYNGTAGLNVTFAGDAASFNHTDATFIRAIESQDLQGFCPNEAITGMAGRAGPGRFWRDTGPQPIKGGEYWFTMEQQPKLCTNNFLEGLQPKQFTRGSSDPEGPYVPYYGYKSPDKGFLEAAAYVVHVPGGPVEKFSDLEIAFAPSSYCGLCDPLGLLARGGAAGAQAALDQAFWHVPGSVGSDAPARVGQGTAAVAEAIGQANGLTGPTHTWIADAKNGLIPLAIVDLPFPTASFRKDAQHAKDTLPVASRVLHNYVVINQSHAFALMNDPWNPSSGLKVSDNFTTGLESQDWEPTTPPFVQTQWLPEGDEKDPHAGVTSWSATETVNGGGRVEDPDDAEPRIEYNILRDVSALAANGQSGSGYAVQVEAKGRVVVTDGSAMFTEGHTFKADDVYTVRVLELGGLNRTGSDCAEVPLYDYVQKFMRCTGYSVRYATTQQVGASGSPTACLSQTRDFVALGANEGARLVDNSSRVFWHYGDPVDNALYRSLLGDGFDPEAPPIEANLTYLAEPLMQHGADMALAAALLVLCTATTVSIAIPDVVGAVASLVGATLEGWEDINQTARAESAQLATEILHPTIALLGEPVGLGGETVTPVSVEIFAPTPFGWYGAADNISVELLATRSAYPLNQVELRVETYGPDDSLIAGPELVLDTTGEGLHNATFDVAHGNRYELAAYVADEAGNWDSDAASFRVDRVAPTFLDVSNVPLWLDQEVAISWDASDALSGLHNSTVDVDNGTGYVRLYTYGGSAPGVPATFGFDLNVSAVNGRQHHVRINLTDEAELITTLERTITEDHQDPLLLEVPTVLPFVNADLLLEFAAVDQISGLHNVTYTQIGGAADSDQVFAGTNGLVVREGSVSVPVAGHHNTTIGFDIVATDKVGRTASWSDAATVDLENPWLTSIPAALGSLVTADAALSWTVQENVSGLAAGVLSLKNELTGQTTILEEYDAVSPGDPAPARSHNFAIAGRDGQQLTLSAVETDGAGNTRSWSQSFSVDLLGPSVSVSTDLVPLPSGWFTGTVEVTLDIEDTVDTAPTALCSIDGGTSVTCPTSVTLTGDGIHTIDVDVTDDAGHQTLASFYFGIDSSAPIPAFILPLEPNGSLDNGTLRATVTARDLGTGIMSLRARVSNETIGATGPLLFDETMGGFVETFDDGTLSELGWTRAQSGSGNTVAVVSGGSNGTQSAVGLFRVNTNDNPAQATHATKSNLGLGVAGGLAIMADWKWVRSGGVVIHHSQIELDFRDPDTADLKTLIYHIGKSPGSSNPLPAADQKYVYLAADQPQSNTWAHIERNVTEDLGTLLGATPERFELDAVRLACNCRGFSSHEERSWFDNVRILRALPGEKAVWTFEVPVWHSGDFRVQVDADDLVGSTAVVGDLPTDSFPVWITPVPDLRLDIDLLGTTVLNGIPISRTSSATVIEGLGFSPSLASALPAGTSTASLWSNGTRESTGAGAAVPPFALNAFAFDVGPASLNLTANSARGSWNQTEWQFTTPGEVSVSSDLESGSTNWTFASPSQTNETAEVGSSTSNPPAHRASGDKAVYVKANHTTADGASARFNFTVDSGAPRIFAKVFVNASTPSELANRTKWFDLLTPRNGTTPLVRVGWLDGDNSIDVAYGSSGGSTAYDVFDLEPGNQYQLEARVYDDDVELYVDGAFVAGYGRWSSDRVDNVYFGAVNGTGDVGEVWVDDVGIAEGRPVAHEAFQDSFEDGSLWTGISQSNVAIVSSYQPFDKVLRITTSTPQPRVVSRSIPTNATDGDWSFYVAPTASSASPTNAASHVELFNVSVADGSVAWAIAMTNGTTLSVWDGTAYAATTTELTLGNWSRFDVAVTPMGYRVWMNGSAVQVDGGNVLTLGAAGPPATLTIGNGSASFYLDDIQFQTGQRVSVLTAEGGESFGASLVKQASRAKYRTIDEFSDQSTVDRFVSGIRAPYADGRPTAGETDGHELEARLFDRFSVSTWFYLPSNPTVVFENFTILATSDAVGNGGFEATLSGTGPLIDLYMAQPQGGFGAQTAASPRASLARGQWIHFVFEVDQINETVTMSTSTGKSAHEPLYATGLSRILFGDLRSAGTIGDNGNGEGYWDDLVVQAYNKHPVPVVDSSVPSSVSADFVLTGTVDEEAQDALVALDVRVGSGDWYAINREGVWSTEISTSGWTDGDLYWLNARASDGDRFGTDSVQVCYLVSATDCSSGTVHGARATKVGEVE